MSFKKEVIIDCKGHLLGRLASIVAKELLNGQHITCLRTEDINISGSLFRNKLKYADFRRKKMSTNPRRGPFHYRAPAKMLWRTIRGMIPHKTPRGAAALDRLKSFEGMPHPYDIKKKLVVPQALKVLRLKPERRFCRLGDLAKEVGWKQSDVLDRLEKQRKARAAAWYVKKRESKIARSKAIKEVGASLPAEDKAILEKAGML
mmetsp:Transcript_17778/g.39956  ORF Transcript_17778/g.39956 Transcript_17778/m.39956 type:complete len:204 (-) Transcript_17778:54-665(-)